MLIWFVPREQVKLTRDVILRLVVIPLKVSAQSHGGMREFWAGFNGGSPHIHLAPELCMGCGGRVSTVSRSECPHLQS